MKKKVFLFTVLFLLISISLLGCDNSNEELSLTPMKEVLNSHDLPTQTPTDETITIDTTEMTDKSDMADMIDNTHTYGNTDMNKNADSVDTTDATDTSEDTEGIVADNLLEVYDGYFKIGIAMSGGVELKNWDRDKDIIINNFNTTTCTNEMKPSYLLSQSASIAGLKDGSTYNSPAVSFKSAEKTIQIAKENGIPMRLHTLVWHAQTPKWFFVEDYSNNGEFIDRDTMLMRMESYIKQVLEYFQTEHPGLIYAVDVVNEAFNGKITTENPYGIKLGTDSSPNYWYDIIGEDYLYYAFLYSRKYASEDMKLFYNDYNTYNKIDQIINGLQKIQDENLIDGIGMQGHISTKDLLVTTILRGVKAFSAAGYEVQITELDIGLPSVTESSLLRQGMKYNYLMTELKKMVDEGINFTNVTLWGLTDRVTKGHWRAGEAALLFDEHGEEKPAYRGMLQDPAIPAMDFK